MDDTEQGEWFVLKIDYEKDSLRPSRVFRAMSELIEGFQALDNDLLLSFPIKVEPILMLEDIQVGSLRSVIKNVLKGVDDEAIKNLEWKKMIGSFLLQGKHAVIKWIEEREQIETRQALEGLSLQILQLAEGTHVLHLPAYSPPPLPLLIKDIASISSAVGQLSPHDSATYEAEGAVSSFNKNFHIDEEFAQELLTDEKITNKSEVLLRVKKPDYLGESMWEFVHAGHIIHAKIEDHDWLVAFQFQKTEVRPGDSLRVILETTTHHGSDGEELFTYYCIVKVIGIKKAAPGHQLELPSGDK
jgi:hypothetical protein